MQIHEITKQQLNEAGLLGQAASALGQVVGAVKNTGTAAPAGALGQAFQQGLQKTIQAAQEKNIQAMAQRALRAWQNFESQVERGIVDPNKKASYERRLSPNIYKKNLTAWAQKNLFGGMDLNSLINKTQVQEIINKLSLPRPQAVTQEPNLFQELVRQASVAQYATQQARAKQGTARVAAPKASTPQQAQANLGQAAKLSQQQIAAIQQVVGPLPAVKSTDPATIAYLKALGFDAQ